MEKNDNGSGNRPRKGGFGVVVNQFIPRLRLDRIVLEEGEYVDTIFFVKGRMTSLGVNRKMTVLTEAGLAIEISDRAERDSSNRVRGFSVLIASKNSSSVREVFQAAL